jgi:hypothetical protein
MTCEVTVRIDDRIEVLFGEKGGHIVDEHGRDAMCEFVAQSASAFEGGRNVRVIDPIDFNVGIARQKVQQS